LLSIMIDSGSTTALLPWLASEIDRIYDRVRDLPVAPTISVAALRRAVAAKFDLEQGRPLAEVVEAASSLLEQHSLHVTHPRYFGLFNPSVHPSSVLADALVALFNPQVGGWSHGPAAFEMEQLVLRRITSALGHDPDRTVAHFTSGGNEANHTAVIAALAHRYDDWAQQGLRALPRQPVIYLSEESHHSFLKIARATGLGASALRHVHVDTVLRMRLDHLAEQVVADRAAGRDPLMVVATAGTTGAGVIDPLPGIVELSRAEGLWVHVDAAWGGAAAIVPRLRHYLAGIEHADSVTLDAHKWLSVPLGAGILFTRHPHALSRAFGVETGYVPPTQSGGVDLYKMSMQWSRRFIGLKLLFAFAEHGEKGMARFVEHQAAMGDLLRERLRERGWQVVNETPFPLVCFTHPRLGTDDASTKALVGRVLERGRVWISDVPVKGVGWVIRACITSYRTEEGDLDVLLNELSACL
jgi:glutamate/tyrosine decarboxylase-like PLP-dependent enzyme